MRFDLEHSSFQLGENEISLKDLCENSGRDYSRTLARSGFSRLFRTDKSEIDFFRSFLRQNPSICESETIIIVNQSSDAKIPGLAALLLREFEEAGRARVVQISDGCTGFLRALLLADSILSRESSNPVSIVCAEKYSQFLDSGSTSFPIFSDAISHVRLIAEPGFVVRSAKYLNSFGVSEGISISTDGRREILQMEGAKVLNWTLRAARSLLDDLSGETDLDLASLDRWYIHQGSRVVVESVATVIGIDPADSFEADDIGNTVSSSIPISLIRRGLPTGSPSRIGMLAFGVGLSMVGAVLESEA